MVKPRRQRKSRANKSMAGPDMGDIPRPLIRTYTTKSTSIPPMTDSCTLRCTQTSVVTASASAAVNGVYYFSLTASNLSTGPFDQYRIEAIRFSVIPQNNAIGLVTNSTTSLVPLYSVIDYDDANALGSANAAVAYNNCVTLAPGESCERLFKPRMALAAYSGAFTSYSNTQPTWIDVVSPGVQHYGIKLFIPQATVAQTLLQSWEVVQEYWISLRNAI
jgi:hypothetical protein